MQEKDGHLQFCILDVTSSIADSERDPQALRHYSPITNDPTVEYPRVWIGKSNLDMFRNRNDDKKATFGLRKIRGRDLVTPQNIEEMPLSLLRTETLRYIPID